MCHVFSHFSGFWLHFVKAESATTSIQVKSSSPVAGGLKGNSVFAQPMGYRKPLYVFAFNGAEPMILLVLF